jgi:rhodanese-related sulfurtransferase
MTTKLDEILSPEDAREAAASDGRTLDIRDDDQWEEGRVPGALHVTEEEVLERLDDIPEDVTVVVVCEDGERSAKLAAKLRDAGRQAASIEGGMKAWKKDRNLPLEPRPDEEFEGPDYTGTTPAG